MIMKANKLSYILTLSTVAMTPIIASANGVLDINLLNDNDSPAYILIKGNDPQTNKQAFIQIDSNGLGSYVDIQSDTDSTQYTYNIDDLPLSSAGTNEYGHASHGIRVPNLTSGRMYYSYGSPLQAFEIVGSEENLAIADPNVFNQNDPNYNTKFDKVEFTYNQDGTTWINPTAVDFVSLPLTIDQAGKQYGLTVSQQQLDDTMSNETSGIVQDDDYKNLIVRNSDNTLLRILAPGRDDSSFNKNYLDDTITQYWSYYKDHDLTIDCSEVNPTDGIFSGGVNDNDILVLRNTKGKYDYPDINNNVTQSCLDGLDTEQVCIEKPASDDFFQAAGNLKNTGNMPMSVVSKFLSASWAAGLLPSDDTLSKSFFDSSMDQYFKRDDTHDYDLYDAVLHSNDMGVLYGFAYDDVLGIDGTNASNDSHPVTITLHAME